ncbi:MAG TPA: hypothetical protein VIM11_06645 [Tepidisphaeraceae bacterium]|jgi:hypothetical protein
MKWVYTGHDAFQTECQRVAYVSLVRRAADGSLCFRDSDWLNHSLAILKLTHHDFESDVMAVRAGRNAPRLRGEWPPMRPLDVVVTCMPSVLV